MIEELKGKLQAEVERLNHEISFVLPKEIEKALAHGDLRENSEYKAALERQQFAAARLTHLRVRLSKLSGVSEDEIPRDRVGFGSRVTVQDLDTKRAETYALTLGEFIDGLAAGQSAARWEGGAGRDHRSAAGPPPSQDHGAGDGARVGGRTGSEGQGRTAT